jgi:thiamine-monophosphate kinase
MIGDSALGLKALRSGARLAGLFHNQTDELIRRYRIPEPRLALAPLLREYASAAMDISDGLAGDLGKLAASSGVGAAVEVSKVPLSNPAFDALETVPALLQDVLTGGDDYEVLAAIPEARFPGFAEAAGVVGIPVTAIGRFSAGEGIRVIGLDGKELSFAKGAYSHF